MVLLLLIRHALFAKSGKVSSDVYAANGDEYQFSPSPSLLPRTIDHATAARITSPSPHPETRFYGSQL